MCTFFCLTWKRNFLYMFFGRTIFFTGQGGLGGFLQSSPMILACCRRKKFWGISPWKKKKHKFWNCKFAFMSISMFQNFQIAASCAHFWNFFLVFLAAGEKHFEGVCFVSKSCQLYTFLEFNFFQKNEKKKTIVKWYV